MRGSRNGRILTLFMGVAEIPRYRRGVGGLPQGREIAFDSGGYAAIECAPFEVYLLNF